MDEEELETNLEAYKSQVAGMEAALSATDDVNTCEELAVIITELRQLVQLTEESLLALKKSKLMAQFEGPAGSLGVPSGSNKKEMASDMDVEFAAFQAALAGDVTNNDEESGNDNSDFTDQNFEYNAECSNSSGEDSRLESKEIPKELEDISGSKCRVPYTQEWGETLHQNAMVVCAEPITSEGNLEVRVLFINPTQIKMVPCPYFLDGKCKFDVKSCKFSHGYVISVHELMEYKEPDHSLLQLESKCLAKYKDGVWYKSKIVDVKDNAQYSIVYDSYPEVCHVDSENIIPVDCEEDSDNDSISLSEYEDDNTSMVYERPLQTTNTIGEWEKHTKGIGSKLMARMGYVTGQGLGKDGRGRAEPVPIQVLPQGKTLDKIMELKEKAGNKDLFDAMSRQKKRQLKTDKNAANSYNREANEDKSNVFDFINKKLKGKKGDLHQLTKGPTHVNKKSSKTQISQKDLKAKSDKHLNIQMLKTEDEMKNVNSEIAKLKTTLQRNRENKSVATKINQKISSMESYLQQLKNSSHFISKHKQSRKDHKKLTVF